MTLQQHLAAVAAQTDLRIGTTAAGLWNVPAMIDFRTAIAGDPILENGARAMLGSIDERVALRDHVTRWNKAALQAALGETS